MNNYSHRSKITNLKPGVAAAVKAINTLQVRSGVDKKELTIRLCNHLILLHVSKNFKRRSGRDVKRWSQSASKEITKLQSKFGAITNSIEIELKRLAFYQDKSSLIDDAYKAIKKLQELRELLESMPPFKSGNRKDRLAIGFGLILADIYHEATGKAPTHKSNDGSGPFYRFVKAATANTIINANTATRKVVNFWKSQNSDPPKRSKKKSKKTTLQYFDIYKEFAKDKK